jgi:hypothetical protein
MKSITKDKAEGKLDNGKDTSTESTGKLGKDLTLKDDDKDEKAVGKDQEDIGQLERF